MSVTKILPYFAQGIVVKGFGRGSKELGIPTANLSDNVISYLPEEIPTGIYFGWSKVDNSSVYKMVMSIGWNPYYNNKKKSMEAHVIHSFPEDFYGSSLRVAIVGFIRPEKNFSCLNDLIQAIRSDIAEAQMQLEKPENKEISKHMFFQ